MRRQQVRPAVEIDQAEGCGEIDPHFPFLGRAVDARGFLGHGHGVCAPPSIYSAARAGRPRTAAGRPDSPDVGRIRRKPRPPGRRRSEEHTSELQSLMRISYAVFCLKKKTTNKLKHLHITTQ